MGNQNTTNEEFSRKTNINLKSEFSSQLKNYLNLKKSSRPITNNLRDTYQRKFNFKKSGITISMNCSEAVSLSQLITEKVLSCLDKRENNNCMGNCTFFPIIFENDNYVDDDIKLLESQNNMFDNWIKPIPNTQTPIDHAFKCPFEFKTEISHARDFSWKQSNRKNKKWTYLRKKTIKKTVKGYTLINRFALKKKKKLLKKSVSPSLNNKIEDEVNPAIISDVIQEKSSNQLINNPKLKEENNNNRKVLNNSSSKQILLKKTCLNKIIKRNKTINPLSSSSQSKNQPLRMQQHEINKNRKPFIINKIENLTKHSSELKNISKKDTHNSLINEVKPQVLVIDIRQLENEDKVLFDFTNFNPKIDTNRQSPEQIPKFIKEFKPHNSLNSNYNIHKILIDNANTNNKNRHLVYNKFKESIKSVNKTNSDKFKSNNKEKLKFSSFLIDENQKKLKKMKAMKANTVYSRDKIKKGIDSLLSDHSEKNLKSKKSVNHQNHPINPELDHHEININLFSKNDKQMSNFISKLRVP